MTSVSQEDEFTEVTHKRKKRKVTGSPTLPTLQKTGSSELPPGTPTHPKPAIIKTTFHSFSVVSRQNTKIGVNYWAN